MRILVAPNALKGSLSPSLAARAIKRGILRALPEATTVEMPIADGGDGLIDALRGNFGGVVTYAPATGPLGTARRAGYLWSPKRKTAVIESALASGLALIPESRRDPLRATSAGTGDLIRHAARRGARTIVVGLGGAASNDGGAGMAQALGARILDDRGRPLAGDAASLLRAVSVDASASDRLLRGIRVIGLVDVDNPLCGPRGSARVFGPQKGADAADVRLLENAMALWAKLLHRELGVDVARARGGAAAGGLGAGLLAFARAELVPGAAWVLRRVGAARALSRCAAAITAEGRLDATSLRGKATVELCRLARRGGVPAAVLCGDFDVRTAAAMRRAGVTKVVTLSEAGAASSEDAMKNVKRWLSRAAATAVTGLMTAALLMPPRARAAENWNEVDSLYFHRDKAGALDKDLALLDAAVAARPADADARWRRGRALIRRGEIRPTRKEKLADYEAARDECDAAVKASPDSSEAHFWFGVAMGRWGETKGVLKSLFLVKPIRREMETVLRLDPSHGGAHRVLGEILWQLPGFAGGDKKAALQEFESAASLSPRHTANYLPLARAYAKADRRADALKTLTALDAVVDADDPAEAPGDAAEGRALRAELEKVK